MAYMISPGIEIKEHNIAGYVPGVASTEGGIGGVFAWGPVEDADLISNENELVVRFGKPTEDNFETFHIASNFLSYSDALYVVRAADANAFNAVANTGAIANTQIKNETDFSIKKVTLAANNNGLFYARYPGAIGNSLRVSVCDSPNAFSSTFANSSNCSIALAFTYGSNTATFTVTNANNAVANAHANTIVQDIQIGDYILASNSQIGSQYLKVASISGPLAANGVATTTIGFASRYQMAENIVMANSFTRYWEFYNAVNKAPGTSTYTESRGGNGDEMHIIVTDEDGRFTGTPGTILESWTNLSRATDATGEQTSASIYYKNVLENSSRYIYAVADRAGAVSNTAANIVTIDTLPLSMSFTGGTDSQSESAIGLGALSRAYDQFKNPDDIDVSILIAGRATGGVHGEALANYIVDNIAETRRDLVVTISPASTDVVNNPFLEAEATLQFRDSLRKSSYSMISVAYKYQYDRYNDKWRWIAGCGDDAGLIARTDKDRDPWWSMAGHNRGVYKNLSKMAYNPDQADRDLLYKNDINPVLTERGVGAGAILYGDKTLLGTPSAFDRMNVRRLFIVIEKAIKKANKQLLFEFNDEFTRARFRNMVNPYLRDVQGRRGIIDFKVICDQTNNPGVVIDRNEFVGDIYIKPAKSINFIKLNFVAVGTDVQFEYVIGQFG